MTHPLFFNLGKQNCLMPVHIKQFPTIPSFIIVKVVSIYTKTYPKLVSAIWGPGVEVSLMPNTHPYMKEYIKLCRPGCFPFNVIILKFFCMHQRFINLAFNFVQFFVLFPLSILGFNIFALFFFSFSIVGFNFCHLFGQINWICNAWT